MWRSSPLPPDWPATVKRIRKRDATEAHPEGQCTAILPNGTRCPEGATGGVHHRGDPNDHRDHMLGCACSWHHGKDTSARANRARRRVTQKRPTERHPGLR